jgi:hypothetical protein
LPVGFASIQRFDDRADVETSVRRHRCDARGEIAVVDLAIERRDPAVESRGPLAIAHRLFLERHAACGFRNAESSLTVQ